MRHVWTLRAEGEATCITSGLCRGAGSHVRHVWTLRWEGEATCITSGPCGGGEATCVMSGPCGGGEVTCVMSGLCGGATCCHVVGGQPKPHSLGQEQSSRNLDSGPDGRQLPCVLGPLPWPL